MSDLSELINKLYNDGVLHLTASTTGVGSGVVDVTSPDASSSWFPFASLFFNLC